MNEPHASSWTVTEEYEVTPEITHLEGDNQIVRYIACGWRVEGRLSAGHALIRGWITVESEGFGETPGQAMEQASEALRLAWEARIGQPWRWT